MKTNVGDPLYPPKKRAKAKMGRFSLKGLCHCFEILHGLLTHKNNTVFGGWWICSDIWKNLSKRSAARLLKIQDLFQVLVQLGVCGGTIFRGCYIWKTYCGWW